MYDDRPHGNKDCTSSKDGLRLTHLGKVRYLKRNNNSDIHQYLKNVVKLYHTEYVILIC